MHTFRIDPDNRITLLGAKQKRATAAEAAAGICFRSQPELAQVVQNWPMTRLVAIWNGLEGISPVHRFAHRQAAVSRIWKALQRKPQAPIVGPVEPHSKKRPGDRAARDRRGSHAAAADVRHRLAEAQCTRLPEWHPA